MLFDGGYYDRAYKLLQKHSTEDFHSKEFKLEYTYRLGRITHKMERSDEAIAIVVVTTAGI